MKLGEESWIDANAGPGGGDEGDGGLEAPLGRCRKLWRRVDVGDEKGENDGHGPGLAVATVY